MWYEHPHLSGVVCQAESSSERALKERALSQVVHGSSHRRTGADRHGCDTCVGRLSLPERVRGLDARGATQHGVVCAPPVPIGSEPAFRLSRVGIGTQQFDHQRVLCVHPVFRLVPHERAVRLEHVVGDLLAAVGGETV